MIEWRVRPNCELEQTFRIPGAFEKNMKDHQRMVALRRGSGRLISSIASAFIMLSGSTTSHAVTFNFSPIPGNVGYGVALDGDNIAFASSLGIYFSSGGVTTPVVVGTTSIPGSTGTFLGAGYGTPWIDGQSVIFQSQTSYGQGIYMKSDASAGALEVVADLNTTMPGTPLNFTSVGGPALSDGVVTFVGQNTTFGESGVYKLENGQLDLVVNNHTFVPGSSTHTFNAFSWSPVRDGNSIIFNANSSVVVGLFRETGGSIQEVLNNRIGGPSAQPQVANQPAGTYLTGVQSFSVDSGDIAFYGSSSLPDPGSQGGTSSIFLASNGVVTNVASTHTAIPGGVGNFTGFDPFVTIDDGNVVFTASGANGQRGLYTTLGGSLTKVVDTNSVFDGKPAATFFGVTSQAMSGNKIGFTVVFADNSRGGYIASFDADPIPTSAEISTATPQAALLGGAFGSETGGLDADFGSSIDAPGTFAASYSQVDNATFSGSYSGTSGFDVGNFLTTGAGGFQVWDLDFDGQLSDGGQITLQFQYDDTGLTALQEAALGIWHYGEYGVGGSRRWQWLRDNIDTVANVITITTDNFSPFSVGLHLMGDFNNDQVVDALDYTVWRNNFGDADETDINHSGDGGDIGVGDFEVWKAHYGETMSSGSGGLAAVPEPTTCCMFGLVGIAFIAIRRTRT
jgi:hypothetical protein